MYCKVYSALERKKIWAPATHSSKDTTWQKKNNYIKFWVIIQNVLQNITKWSVHINWSRSAHIYWFSCKVLGRNWYLKEKIFSNFMSMSAIFLLYSVDSMLNQDRTLTIFSYVFDYYSGVEIFLNKRK